MAEVRLLDSDVQLVGERAAKVIPIYVDKKEPQAVRLKLELRTSTLIHAKRSTINVKLNGQTRSTRRLSEITDQTLALNFRPLKPGRHELSVEVFLRSDEDCHPTQEGLWLTLQETSTIFGAEPVPPEDFGLPPALAVKDFPAVWDRPTGTAPSAQNQPMTKVALSHDLPWNAAAAGSLLQAQVFLANRALSVQLQPEAASPATTDKARARLMLRHADRLPKDHPLLTRWQSSKDLQYVVRVVDRQSLEITARDSEGINLALDMMGWDEHRDLCVNAVCSLTMSPAELKSQLAAKRVVPPDLPLWSMAQGDQPRGWTAKGVGTHRLRQVWVRPVGQQLKSEIALNIAARISQAQSVDFQQSSISVRINDALLATYSLADWKEGQAKLPIPRSLWSSAAWLIDFDVRLVHREVQRCSYVAHDDIWVILDPTTRLTGRVQIEDDASIAGFWYRATGRPTTALEWLASEAKEPSPQQITQLVPLVQSIAVLPTGPTAMRWQFVSSSVCREQPCIQIHSAAKPESANSAVLPWRKLLTSNPEVTRRLPDLETSGGAIMAWSARSHGSPEQLHVALGTSVEGKSISVAPLSSFFGKFAAHADKWTFYRDPDVLVDPNFAWSESGDGNASQQQSRLRWINLLWALGSFLIVGFVAARLWRKKKKPDPKSWEVQ